MKQFWIIVSCLLLGCTTLSAQVDVDAIVKKAAAADMAKQSYPVQFSFVVDHFMGSPYVEQTLEKNEKEALVVNTTGFDCVTLIENVVAVCQVIDGQESVDQFPSHLQENRYYEGKIDGYESRIHYFSAWLQSADQRGLLGSITRELGEKYDKPIYFISQNLDKYPKVKRSQMIVQREKDLNSDPVWYLPKTQVDTYKSSARSGDLLALTTNIKGLDVVHTGFSYVDGQTVYLLHASSKAGKVIKTPLADYLKKYSYMTGVIIYRPAF